MPTDRHYLNCAYMSPLSKRVQEAGRAGMAREAMPWRLSARDFFDGCDRVRALFAELVGLEEPGRIAVVPAVSYGVATVARNIHLEAGQNVVTLEEQFPSNVHAWRRLCDGAGAELRVVEARGPGASRTEVVTQALLDAVDAGTALVAVGTVHWTDGTRIDLERLGERARQVGAALVVDGTQSIGAEPLDLASIRPDALLCAGYKWLTGPYSLGVAYLGPRFDDGVPLEETWAGRAGSDDFASLVRPSAVYRPGAARYDMGESAGFTLVPMLVAALEQLLEWRVPRIHAYVERLTCAVFADDRLDALGMSGESPSASHLFGLRLPEGMDPGRVQARLAEREVDVSVRGRVIRVSPHIYNDEGDVDALLDGLSQAAR